MHEQRLIVNIPAISAIYYSLLQCGYDYYSMEKAPPVLKKIEELRLARDTGLNTSFFEKARRSTCAVYPYWPRAAMLETATFYIDHSQYVFSDFEHYYHGIMSAANISGAERNDEFWDWIHDFPQALASVRYNDGFQEYLQWEDTWIAQENLTHQDQLAVCEEIIAFFVKHYDTPIRKASIVLNPIKCAYSSDHRLSGDTLFVISGAFRADSVLHEFLHHIVHPVVDRYSSLILKHDFSYTDTDKSYSLDGDASGKLNAFEEHMVRTLTRVVLEGSDPGELDSFLLAIVPTLQ